jgi:hypothetical protein
VAAEKWYYALLALTQKAALSVQSGPSLRITIGSMGEAAAVQAAQKAVDMNASQQTPSQEAGMSVSPSDVVTLGCGVIVSGK